jgi:hypothetical protein
MLHRVIRIQSFVILSLVVYIYSNHFAVRINLLRVVLSEDKCRIIYLQAGSNRGRRTVECKMGAV